MTNRQRHPVICEVCKKPGRTITTTFSMIISAPITAHDVCRKYKEHIYEQKRLAEVRKEDPQKTNRRTMYI